MRSEDDLVTVRQVVHNHPRPGDTKPSTRTAEEKFKEAVRATQLISSELADIEDDDEFDEYLEFLLNQWRNVRQRKRVRVDDGTSNVIAQVEEPCTQPSQAHSLWSDDIGGVTMIGTNDVVIQQPVQLHASSQASLSSHPMSSVPVELPAPTTQAEDHVVGLHPEAEPGEFCASPGFDSPLQRGGGALDT